MAVSHKQGAACWFLENTLDRIAAPLHILRWVKGYFHLEKLVSSCFHHQKIREERNEKIPD
jgi:hypothetical protein